MNKYKTSDKRPPAYFSQGFWIGLIFGALGAVIVLGRRDMPISLPGSPPSPVIEVEVEEVIPPASV